MKTPRARANLPSARRRARASRATSARPIRMLALVLLAGGVVWGCSREDRRPPAPVGLGVALVIEPPRLEIGETATVELAVVTPPDHGVTPVAPPEDLEGVWILASQTPAVERSASRWVHRLRYSVRARELGQFVWPTRRVEVTLPDGSKKVLESPERPFEVARVSAELDRPPGALSLRTAPVTGPRPSPWLAALGGACLTLAGVGLIAWVRRARQSTSGAAARLGPLPEPPGRASQDALRAALGRADVDPGRAADEASTALRSEGERRFGIRMRSATTEELATLQPAASRGDEFAAWVEVLQRLDRVRFLPDAERCEKRSRQTVRGAIERGQELATRSAPKGGRR